ncbi:MAG: TIGR00730 family Rossman fold protein [Ruminococcus sp.]|nr:TIGR00730 family Rossman fold protein [Ruminococcus sp.]
MKQICVFGSSSESIDRAYLAEAEALGKFLAEKGCGVVYGAGKYGVMGAVARGVQAAQGELLGVSPDFFTELNVLKEDYGEVLLTPTMRERKAVMEDKADAFIVCAGGIGTLEEFFEVITLKQLGRHQKPIILLNTCGFYDPMIDMMEQSVAMNFMSHNVHRLYSVADSIDEAWQQLENYRAFGYNKYTE